MILTNFVAPTRESPNAPFVNYLDDEGMVAYHGTSSVFEHQIDAEGLVPFSSPFTATELTSVLEVFRTLRWSGSTAASRAVLEPFSLQYDRSPDQPRRVFFAEHTYRATMYASHDFAGGEAARALRYSFAELDRYFQEKQVQRDHREMTIKQALVRGIQADLPTKEEYDRAKFVYRGLEDLRRRADVLYSRHTHGVIYAVEFHRKDLENLVWNRMMGIEHIAAVHPTRIFAKTHVPKEFSISPYFDPFIFKFPIWNGLLRALRGDA